MLIRICDVCGKQIKSKEPWYSMLISDMYNSNMLTVDYCHECFNKSVKLRNVVENIKSETKDEHDCHVVREVKI